MFVCPMFDFRFRACSLTHSRSLTILALHVFSIDSKVSRQKGDAQGVGSKAYRTMSGTLWVHLRIIVICWLFPGLQVALYQAMYTVQVLCYFYLSWALLCYACALICLNWVASVYYCCYLAFVLSWLAGYLLCSVASILLLCSFTHCHVLCVICCRNILSWIL